MQQCNCTVHAYFFCLGFVYESTFLVYDAFLRKWIFSQFLHAFFLVDRTYNYKDIGFDHTIDDPPLSIFISKPLSCPYVFTSMQSLFNIDSININMRMRITTIKLLRIAEQHLTLFSGHKWKNITVGEMIRFFGTMLYIFLEQRNIGCWNHTLSIQSQYILCIVTH